MSEPAVTLTDYALALECALLAIAIAAAPARERRLTRGFALFFAAVGAGSFLGGTVHGFLPDETRAAHVAFWRATLISIGGATAVGAHLAIQILFPNLDVRRSALAVALPFALYVFLVLAGVDAFGVAVAAYLPVTLLLLFAFARAARSLRAPRIAWGVAGFAAMLVGAAVQQMRVGLHPVHFDHNAVFHVIQGIALVGIFVGARALAMEGLAEGRTTC